MIYIFDHNEELISTVKLSELISAEYTETLDGFTRLDFDVKLNALEKMEGAEFVAHKDVNDENYFFMYRIVTARNASDCVHYTAVNIAHDDLKGYGYLREYRMEKTTAPLALDTILHGSRWQAGITEQTGQSDLYIYDLSRLEAIQKLIKTFGVELEFRVTIKGNQITGRYVDLYQKRGTDTGLRFYYGKNALDVVREEDKQDVFTAVIGRGKGEEKFDSTGVGTGGFGRRINFKDVEWVKGAPLSEDDPMYGIYDTYPLDKTLGDETLELPEATKVHGYSDGTPRYKIVVHDQITEPSVLLWACYDDLMTGARPLVHFKSTVDRAGNLKLGDTVRIIREDLNIYYTARVFKAVRDILDPSMTTIELGDNLEYKQGLKNRGFTDSLGSLNERVSEVASSTQYTFNQVIEDMREGLENSYYNNDGYNYELRTGNKYGLPAGYYSFNSPIDENPSKVIYMGAGMMAIANRKKSDGTWDWQTFGTGDGLLAESIIGTLGEFARVNANQITVSDDFAGTDLGKKVVVQDELYNNVKITGSKGIQVLDNRSRERVQLGNWASGRYGLKLTDPSGTRTVLDDQGILQSWQDSFIDNVDNGYPLNISVYIPDETKIIYTGKLRLRFDDFRAYSRGTDYKAQKTETSGGGGYTYKTPTSESGGYQYVSETSEVDRYILGSTGGHDHGITPGTTLQFASGSIQGHNVWVKSGNHKHDINFTIKNHTHDYEIKLPDHTHPFTIPGHSHDTIYGIHTSNSYGTLYEVIINGVDRTKVLTGYARITNDKSDMDVEKYLNKGWNTISIRSDKLGRVNASIFVQALMQFPGV